MLSNIFDREYILSAFALHVILFLKVLVEINLSCHVQRFLLSGKLEMISIDVIVFSLCICIFWRKIAVSLKLNIVSHIP